MSQKKVEKYKEQKGKRKELIKKEKRKHMLINVAIVLSLAVVFGWIGYSAYDSYIASRPREVVEVNYDAMNQYLEGLSETK